MKNNISYYRHESGSHNHWKFKTLRRSFGWAGEGKFWALNNMIAESENCLLDISDEYKQLALATELDFDLEQLNEFLKVLIKIKLIVKIDNNLTTQIIQETFQEVSKNREKDRFRKNNTLQSENRDFHTENKGFQMENDIFRMENKDFRADFEQSKVKESKLKEIKRVVSLELGGLEERENNDLKSFNSENQERKDILPVLDEIIKLTKDTKSTDFWISSIRKLGKDRVSGILYEFKDHDKKVIIDNKGAYLVRMIQEAGG